jgi:tRNA-5-taurinomethyluridine 2-sulfurtransferase
MQVCAQLGVPLTTLPLTKQYWDRVVSFCVKEIHSGRTPNPDVLCNSRVKFGAFFEYLHTHPAQFDRVASGHYARVDSEPYLHAESLSDAVTTDLGGYSLSGTHQSDSSRSIAGAQRRQFQQQRCKVRLRLTPDSWKDQTYFLANLSQQQLQSVLFPLGHLTKKKVRELAAAAHLPTMARKDSQGICFLGKVKFNEFIKVLFHSKRTRNDRAVLSSAVKLIQIHPDHHRGMSLHVLEIKLSSGRATAMNEQVLPATTEATAST